MLTWFWDPPGVMSHVRWRTVLSLGTKNLYCSILVTCFVPAEDRQLQEMLMCYKIQKWCVARVMWSSSIFCSLMLHMSHLPVGGIRFEIGKEKKLFFLAVLPWWGVWNWVWFCSCLAICEVTSIWWVTFNCGSYFYGEENLCSSEVIWKRLFQLMNADIAT